MSERFRRTVCEEHDLGSIVRGSLMMGILTGNFNADSQYDEQDSLHSLGFDFSQGRLAAVLAQGESIRQVLASDGCTMAQGALGWIWANSERPVPIPGFKNVKHAEQNAKVAEFSPLSDAQVADIKAILVHESAKEMT